MDAIRIETLPTSNSLLNTKLPETTNILKEKDEDISFDEIDEDDEIRLRLSDDEDIEQDSIGNAENQQTSFQLNKNDLDLISSKRNHKESIIEHKLSETGTTSTEEDDSSGNSSLNDKVVNGDSSVDEEELIMSGSDRLPSLMQNSPKYWSNNFNNKRWKGTNQSRNRQNFSRNSNDWYSQQYSDKDKLNHKSNYNNHNHFNKLKSNSRENYKSPSRDSCNKDLKKDDDQTPTLKNNLEHDNKTKHSIKENGISKDLHLNEDKHLIKNEKTNTENKTQDENKTKTTEINSDHKENECVNDDSKLSSDHKCEKNSDNPTKDSSEIIKIDKKETDDKSANTSSVTEDCDVSISESEEKKCELKSEKTNEKIQSSSNDDVQVLPNDTELETKDSVDSKNETETLSKDTKSAIINSADSNNEAEILSDDAESDVKVSTDSNNETESLSNDEKLEIKDSVNVETMDNTETETAEVVSHTDDVTKEDCENSVKVNVYSENSSNVDDENDNDDQISTSKIDKNNDVEVDEKDSEGVKDNILREKIQEDEKCISEIESKADSNTGKVVDKVDINEESNYSLENEKSLIINDMEISEVDLNDETDVTTIDDDKTNELMEIDTDSESSVVNVKGSDSKLSSKKDEKNSSEISSSPVDEKESVKEEKPLVIDQEIKELNQEKENIVKEKSNTVDSTIKEESSTVDLKKEEKLSIEDSKIEETSEKKKPIIIEEVELIDDEPEMAVIASDDKTTLKNKVETAKDVSPVNETSQTVPISTVNNDKVEESSEDGRAVVHKRRRRKRPVDVMYDASTNEIPTDNGVRQKRRSARNAEEMIRKEMKNDEEDDESSDGSEKLVAVNYKKNNGPLAQPLSPPSLKRTLDEVDCVVENGMVKKVKFDSDNKSSVKFDSDNKSSVPSLQMIPIKSPEKKVLVHKSKESIAQTNEQVRKISQEDIRGKLKKLTQEELEAMLLQKIVECITIRGEMGKLREQARVSQRNQEATRVKCQQLQKQVEGFEMVIRRINHDKTSNNDKYIAPIKINRSVGLQVNFVSEHGIQSLKQVQLLNKMGISTSPPNKMMTANIAGTIMDNRSQSPKKMMKTRPPRRLDISNPTVIQANSGAGSPASVTANGNNATPAALVMNKTIPVDSNTPKRIGIANTNNIVQLIPSGQNQQTVVVNSTVGGAPSRPATLMVQRSIASANNKNTSDLIDLTDEEDKSKPSIITPITTATINSRFPTVLKAVPASVALSNANLRLVQTNSQGSPTSVVNNMNQRLAYVMQSGVNGVPTRQLVLATSSNSIRPVTSTANRNLSTISYKTGMPGLTNGGTVRVLTTQAPSTNIQVATRHPAPLPETPTPESNPTWKLAPPAPSLKISKVPTGIVLSWNMTLTDKYAEIVSYQLYAYQEVTGTNPNAALWKKVGDVRALPLPMACTLTQFTEGNNYYFAVRAVDVHSRFGQYSKPGNISL